MKLTHMATFIARGVPRHAIRWYNYIMDPDQKILHLLAPKANPFVYCNLILKMYKKQQALLLCS